MFSQQGGLSNRSKMARGGSCGEVFSRFRLSNWGGGCGKLSYCNSAAVGETFGLEHHPGASSALDLACIVGDVGVGVVVTSSGGRAGGRGWPHGCQSTPNPPKRNNTCFSLNAMAPIRRGQR